MRRKIISLALAAAAVASGSVLAQTPPSPSASGPSACEAAANWVSDHADNLPTTLAAIEKQPISVRRAIDAALPADRRTRLWIKQLSDYRTSENLSAAQARFIDALVERLQHGFFSLPADTRHAVQKRLATQANSLFDAATLGTTFSILGKVEMPNPRPDCDCTLGCPAIGLVCVEGGQNCAGNYCGLLYCASLCELQ